MLNVRISTSAIDNAAEDKLKISHHLFLIFWLLKPFYVFQSGSIQPSDAVFLIAFILWLFENRGEFIFDKDNHFFALFVLSIFFVNFIYTLIHQDFVFLEKSLFYLYSLFIVVSFQKLAINRSFLRGMLLITTLNIFVQLFVFATNLGGRLYGGNRYMGTFNDPNQFSFFLFSSFLLIFVLMYLLKDQYSYHTKTKKYFIFAVVIFLIFQGSSTGAFLGVLGFILALLIIFVTADKGPWHMILRLLFFGLIMFAAFNILSFIFYPASKTSNNQSDSFLIQRVFEKLDRFSAGGLLSILDDRQISRVYFFPLNLLYGAGEGLYGRFVQSEPLEIHSTLIALWFYYGLLPVVLLIMWLKGKLTGLPKTLYPVYIGLFFESLILANQRQPVLWMLIVLADLASSKINPEKSYGIRRMI